MLHNFGENIRTRRKQQELTIKELADKIGVSTGYLSNLETGKTKTIQLTLLEQINKELYPPGISISDTAFVQIDYRIQRLTILLDELAKAKPKEAEFLLNALEDGLDFFKDY